MNKHAHASIRLLAAAAACLLLAACARHKIIPDDKLAQIFTMRSSPTPTSAARV